MNIEIANRLVNLRKENNLSQEALAEKLGISRQAVSKWERAEASPDTDNLILLARLYGISLDDLLKTDEEIPEPEEESEQSTENEKNPYADYDDKPEYVHIGWDGIHVKDEADEVHVGWKGIHVTSKEGDDVHIGPGSHHVYVNGEEYDYKEEWKHYRHEFPIAIICIAVFLSLGILTSVWHPTWLILFIIPVWHSVASAFRHKKIVQNIYSVLAFCGFLYLGMIKALWPYAWVCLLTIPVYHSLYHYFKNMRRDKEKEKEEQ